MVFIRQITHIHAILSELTIALSHQLLSRSSTPQSRKPRFRPNL